MAEKGPPRVRFIKVKPVGVEGHTLPSYLQSNPDNAMQNKNIIERKSGFLTVKTQDMIEHERQIAEIDSSFREVEETFEKHDEDFAKDNAGTNPTVEVEIKEVKKKKKRVKKNAVLPVDVTESDYLDEESRKELDKGEPDNRNDKKKKTNKKSKKKKKKKAKKETAKKENEKKEPVAPVIETTREPGQEIIAASPQNDEKSDDKKKASNLPCCFGFIETWLAKRKQKRRDKKKKAIADRASPPVLAQYQHRKAKGGESFTIEVDPRPIVQKAVLPPIKQTAGPIRRGIDCRLQTAEARRDEELAKRREVARNHERKMIECKERKADADYHFRKKAHLTIRYRQADAERNRNNLSRRTTHNRPTSTIQSSSSESVIIESCPDAFAYDETDPDAWKVDDVDIFSF